MDVDLVHGLTMEVAAMSWDVAHRYYEVLRQAESDLDRTADGVLTWRAEYADVFDSPGRLLLALRSHWTNMVRAQIEWSCEDNWRRIVASRRLAAEHPGLVRAVQRADEAASSRTATVREAIVVGAA
jgi:hypothetical protein